MLRFLGSLRGSVILKIYLVGGALRDELLGLPVKERDWVVVGATPQDLLQRGFEPVGKDFPVFLHPDTHEEYALARTERKVGKGYKGFTFHASPEVTLEEDLQRRDLTINAMARSSAGDLIDPYGGQLDLQRRVLRHVSPAFSEDPVRILRVARFSAKLAQFTVDSATNALMKEMVTVGEVDALVPERVWQEFARALVEPEPVRFFKVLHDCGALAILFPMLRLHGEGMRALGRSSLVQASFDGLSLARLAALFHDVDSTELRTFCQRYRIPKDFSELAKLTCRHTQDYAQILAADAEQLLALIRKTDALRRTDRFRVFLQAERFCLSDDGNELREKRLKHALTILRRVDVAPLLKAGLKGGEIGQGLYELQLEALKKQEN